MSPFGTDIAVSLTCQHCGRCAPVTLTLTLIVLTLTLRFDPRGHQWFTKIRTLSPTRTLSSNTLLSLSNGARVGSDASTVLIGDACTEGIASTDMILQLSETNAAMRIQLTPTPHPPLPLTLNHMWIMVKAKVRV